MSAFVNFLFVLFFFFYFFFFKQKTAYEIGTGDWSSDVCSSDLKYSEITIYVLQKISNLRPRLWL